MKVMLTIIKMFIIFFLLSACENREHPGRQFLKKINKLFFQMSVKVYSFLIQAERERKAFFGGCKKGNRIVRLPPGALCCDKR